MQMPGMSVITGAGEANSAERAASIQSGGNANCQW